MQYKRDYYLILGVSRAATEKEIRQAFRRRSRELHPDINPSPNATRQFQDLNEAYQTLSDPARRARYDRLGYSPRPRPPRPSPPASTSAREEQARQEWMKAKARAEQAQQQKARAEQARAEQVRQEQVRQEWARARARAEQARANAASRPKGVQRFAIIQAARKYPTFVILFLIVVQPIVISWIAQAIHIEGRLLESLVIFGEILLAGAIGVLILLLVAIGALIRRVRQQRALRAIAAAPREQE